MISSKSFKKYINEEGNIFKLDFLPSTKLINLFPPPPLLQILPNFKSLVCLALWIL